jgi:hypothetical protein
MRCVQTAYEIAKQFNLPIVVSKGIKHSVTIIFLALFSINFSGNNRPGVDCRGCPRK